MFNVRRQFRVFRLTAFGWADETVDPRRLPSWEFERLAEHCGEQMEMFPDL